MNFMRTIASFKRISPILLLLIVSGCINLLLWIYTFTQYIKATDLIPLHYTIYFGIDLIDFRSKLFMYPLFGCAVLAVNGALAYFMRRERLMVYFFTAIALFIQIVLCISEISLSFIIFKWM